MPTTPANTPVVTRRYYPVLSSVLDLDAIPDELGFIKDGIVALFDKIHFKDLQYSKSARGDAAFYSLSIVSPKKLALEIPGTGIALVLNPDANDADISAFPITIEYQWKALAYIRAISSIDFNNIGAQEIFEMALMVLNVSEEQAMSQFINIFVVPANASTSPIEQFKTDVNTANPTWTNPIPASANSLTEIVSHIHQESGLTASLVSFGAYLLDADSSITLERVKIFFQALLPTDIEEYIKDVLIPQFKATLKLSAGIEFPRNMLKPVYDASGVDPYDGSTGHEPHTVIPPHDPNGQDPDSPKALITVAEALFYADTEQGIGYNAELVINTITPMQIGNTPLIIDIHNARIDLSDRKNIAAADTEGRPNSFKGVHIEYAEIKLPELWNSGSSSSNPTLVTRNLLVGSEGGLSGTIGITGDNANPSDPAIHTVWANFVIEGISSFSYSETLGKVTVVGKKHTDSPSDEDRVKVFKLNTTTGTRVRDADNNWFEVDTSGSATAISAPNVGSALAFSIGSVDITLEEFSLTFHQNEVVASRIIGTILFPALNGNPLNVIVDISNGFLITVYSGPVPAFGSVPIGSFPETTSGITIVDSNVINITLDGFQIGQIDEIFRLGFAGSITTKLDLPIVNKFIPNNLTVNKFVYREDTGVEFDLDLNWKWGLNVGFSNNGVDTEGVKLRIPLNQDKQGKFLMLEALQLNAVPIPDGIGAEVLLMGAGMKFGKAVVFRIDGLGFGLDFTYVGANQGNVGPFDVDMRVVPPRGIGVKIDAKAVIGGGYLYFGEDEYFGAVELEIVDKFSIVVVGLLNTKLPDGSKGISLVVIVGVTGLNIQLGMGFILDGMGGMLGIQRTMNTDVLREGLRNGTMDSILFPKDVVENIHKIISDIKAVYPIKRKQFVFGPAVRIGWGGGQSLVKLDVGLVIEFPDPVKIALLGRLAVEVGDGEDSIVMIQVAFMAVLNFEKKRFMFDAAIYDSNILTFTLEGDIALRIFWGEHRAFLMSVGGFHPDFQPEENMQVNNMRRLSISLLDDNPRLSINTYMAVTSNTFQFGAGADFYFSLVGVITLEGGFGIDCLFQFNPFYFTMSMYAYLGVYVAGVEVIGVGLEGSLSGTSPWNIKGKASFKLLMLEYSANIDHTWGDKKETSLPDIDVFPLVQAQIELSKNWKGELPPNKITLVTFGEIEAADDDILVHPLGTVSIQQSVVPLGVKLDKYGKKRIDGVDEFHINSVDIGGVSINTLIDTKDSFAPEQYFNMNDDEKLRSKSFEHMKNGIVTQGSNDLIANFVLERNVEYEVGIIDDEVGMTYQAGTYIEHADFNFDKFVKGGAITKSDLSKKSNQRSEVIQNKVTTSIEKYAIVNNDNLDHYDSSEPLYTRAEALSHLNALINNNPNLEDELSVMPEFELI